MTRAYRLGSAGAKSERAFVPNQYKPSACIAWEQRGPCGAPVQPDYNTCYNHLAAGDRRRVDRANALVPQPQPDRWPAHSR